jgi:hypothetical protein
VSIGITNGTIINAFAANPDNTYIVSFPRTGSAWLRMMIELTFGRPTLTRVYFLQDRTDYIMLHTHDDNLTLRRNRVVYLYRDPVDTVYSHLSFMSKDTTSEPDILRFSERYGQHLWKWLVAEKFTHRKTIIRYDRLHEDVAAEMRKIASGIGVLIDDERARAAAIIADKRTMKLSTGYDPKIMREGIDYEVARADFRRNFSDTVWRQVLNNREEIMEWFR